jgi:uncharacterized protein
MSEISDHASMEVLSSEECFGLLGYTPVGRIAFLADGSVQIFPINYKVDGERIVFRSPIGSKLDAAEMGRRVTFEADQWDPHSKAGWSVVANGHIREVADEDRVAELEQIGLEPWLDHPEMNWIEIVIEDISGRRLPD